jgi:Holliday junction resolvasome RuvABC ATP-dependent DNA helicase subunit
MRFFGQRRILRELDYLIPAIQDGLNTAVLLEAASGLGKTTLAYAILARLGWDNSEIAGPPDFRFEPTRRFHFMDEIHRLGQPEALYPIMDSGDHTFIFATNESGSLLEPLYNRCIYTFQFDPYTQGDLMSMCRNTFLQRGYASIPEPFIEFVVDRCGGVPRTLRNLTYRLALIFRTHMPSSIEELGDISTDILNVDENGLDADERKYIDFLKDMGPASLDLISNSTGLSTTTIKKRIEPSLARRRLIRITSKGRMLM